MRNLFILSLTIILIGIGACSKNEKTATLTFNNIQISAEGPLYEGANTAQGEVLNELNAFAKENGIDINTISSARLKSFSISAYDSNDLSVYTGFNIQLASEKTDMIQAAAINQIEPGAKLANGTLSSEQKGLLDLLKQDKFILVADANVASDTSMNIKLIGKMEVEIKY